jgi:hypothetical protein
MAAILTNGVLKISTAPIFQPLLAPARYKGAWEHKGSRCTPANAAHSPPRWSPAPARARRSARRPSSLSATDQPPSPLTHAGAASPWIGAGGRYRVTKLGRVLRTVPRAAPTFFELPKKIRPLSCAQGAPGPEQHSIASPPPGLRRRAPLRQTVERKGDCSPVVFNDIKHLTATCNRRARFRHPVTARGPSHALLPWALPRERATRISAMISMV